MAVHPQQKQQQQFDKIPALAPVGPTGCGPNRTAPSLFQKMMPPTVFSAPASELTCNPSRSRKRSREEAHPPLVPLSSGAHIQQQQQQALLQKLLLLNQMHCNTHQAQPPVEISRLNESTMASCSGRSTLISADPSIASLGHNINTIRPGSSSSPDPISFLHNQSLPLEIESLVRLHTDTLRSQLRQSYKRHCTALVSSMQQQANHRVSVLQAELDAAVKRKAELEEYLKKALAGSQAWFNIAKKREATVTELSACLEKALLRKLQDGNNDKDNINASNCAADDNHSGIAAVGEEGYGDSAEEAISVPAAASAAVSRSVYIGKAAKPSRGVGCSFACRSCGEADACVLLLPCKHLCLCRSCEPAAEICPVCHSRKNASLQVNMS